MFFNEFGDKLFGFSKEAADRAFKANEIATRGVFGIVGLQLAAAEERFNAAAGLAQDALTVRDLETAKAFGPRGWEFTRESFEKLVGANQEVFEVFVKTGKELADLSPVNKEAEVKKPARTAKTA